MVVLTLKRASESPSVVLVMRKKRVNNNDELCVKADMSVVSMTLTPVCVPATWIYGWSSTVIMGLITFDDHHGVKYEPFTHTVNHFGLDSIHCLCKVWYTIIDSNETFYNWLHSHQCLMKCFLSLILVLLACFNTVLRNYHYQIITESLQTNKIWIIHRPKI